LEYAAAGAPPPAFCGEVTAEKMLWVEWRLFCVKSPCLVGFAKFFKLPFICLLKRPLFGDFGCMFT
jgi:hypothetical protein